jgi:hypothetical protein
MKNLKYARKNKRKLHEILFTNNFMLQNKIWNELLQMIAYE